VPPFRRRAAGNTRRLSASPPSTPASFWIASTAETSFASLAQPETSDVAVIGGGIAGITAATLLKAAGRTVTLVDSKRILRGATGYTTAKLTAGHTLLYQYLVKRFGESAARLYAEANQAAIARVAALVERYAIDCDFRRRDNYVYADERDTRSSIEKEVEAATRLGLPASFTADPPLPFATRGAIRLTGQAEFHPRKYLLPLAARVEGDGSRVFEETRALQVSEERGRCRVLTDRGPLEARDALVLTQIPFLDRGLFFAKVHPHRAYVLAASIEEAQAPDGMFISSKSPSRSIRTAPDGAGLLLLVGGEGHKTGIESETERRFATLHEFLRAHFDAGPVEYRWSTQDYYSVDRVPYIGPLTRRSRHIYVATGFGGWGMSNGTLAGMLLADAVLGNENPWARVFDANRWRPRASAARFVKENASVVRRWPGDRLTIPRSKPVSEIGPGEAAVVRVGGRKAAVYREEGGAVHAVSAVCTHLACIVHWNGAERSWDCPCHGSRFGVDGEVLQGPAVRDLERLDPQKLERPAAAAA
jgi:glycine/D-amino acid oxidase-like deaminating enzyme/nitrite reductase/ring-hydroxylating ferredoxin subunit